MTAVDAYSWALTARIMETFFSECCVAFSDSGRPHRIRCGLIEFPMDLILVQSEADKQILTNSRADPTNARTMMQEIFRRRSLLVLGAGLGGGAVKLPKRYYSSFVVLICGIMVIMVFGRSAISKVMRPHGKAKPMTFRVTSSGTFVSY